MREGRRSVAKTAQKDEVVVPGFFLAGGGVFDGFLFFEAGAFGVPAFGSLVRFVAPSTAAGTGGAGSETAGVS